MTEKEEIVSDTMRRINKLIGQEEIGDAVEKLSNDVRNYDKLLISEINKRVEALKHRGIEPDYEKIIKSVHKKFRFKLELFNSIYTSMMKASLFMEHLDEKYDEEMKAIEEKEKKK